MTADCKKLWRQVILRGIGTVAFSWAAVSALVLLLSLYGVSPEGTPIIPTTLQVVKFPENEQMLNETTARLARDGAALSKIEPASGAHEKSK